MPQLAGGGAMIKMQVYLVVKTTGLPLATHTARLPHSYKTRGGFQALN